jgi:hypothetical protein
MSSSFSSPQLIVPSPTPFCPCSSSSSRRKLRGTTVTEQSFYNIPSYTLSAIFTWQPIYIQTEDGQGWEACVTWVRIFNLAVESSHSSLAMNFSVIKTLGM